MPQAPASPISRTSPGNPGNPGNGTVVLSLSLLLGLQPITTDLYLPALPAITQGFGANLAQAQLTLTALLLAFGLSQLWWGPLSDRWGRRPVLLLGLGAYLLASIGSAMAGSMLQLIVWRTVQGIAMGAGVVCARAVVRDLYEPMEGARMMSKALSGLGVIACLSAPSGGLIAEWWGWRMALLVLALFGAATLGVIAWRFDETLAQRNPQALNPRQLLQAWRQILQHPTFLAFSLLSTATYAGLFVFLAASSFVFIQVLGLRRVEYGLAMASMSAVYIAGTFLCRWLLPRLGVRHTVALGGLLSLSGGAIMTLLAWLGVHQLWAILGPYYLFMLGHAIHQPCGQSGAVGPFPGHAGTASALNGFMMMVVAFVIGGWLGQSLDGTVFPMVHGIALASVGVALVAWTLVRRYGAAR